MMKLKPESAGNRPNLPDLRRVGLSAAFGLAVAMLISLGFSMLIWGGVLSPSHMGLWPLVSLALGGLSGGLMAGGRRGALITGGFIALLMLAALCLLGGAVFGGIFSVKMCLMLLLLMPFSCIIGSVLASFIK